MTVVEAASSIIKKLLVMKGIACCLFLAHAAQALSGEDAAYRVVNSEFPSVISSQFQLELDDSVEGFTVSLGDTFDTLQAKIKVTGGTGVDLCAGAYDYLKSSGSSSVAWDATGGSSFPAVAPVAPASPVSKSTKFDFVYAFNVCTYGYSGMWWWDWDRWDHELNLMALNGVNNPLLVLGQEYIWNSVWEEIGLSQEEIDEWNAGPAYAAWFYMGNIKGWEGPISSDYRERTRDLQYKILEKARALGMKPVLPSFSGFVPDALASYVSDPNEIKLASGWNAFEPVSYVEPTSDLFSSITAGESARGAKRRAHRAQSIPKLFLTPTAKPPLRLASLGAAFVLKYCAEFGCESDAKNYWAADLYNELSPPSNDTDYLSSVSSAVFDAMKAADPNAVWVTQGWMFHSDPNFWQTQQVKAFVTGPPVNSLIVLDLHAEQHPIYESTDSFFGTPFVWDTIFNFGGRSGMYGRLEQLTNGIMDAVDGDNTMVGLGIAPEAIETNPISYDLQYDHVYNTELHDVEEYTQSYVQRRYKSGDEATLQSAWKLLLRSVYNATAADNGLEGALGNIFVLRPLWNATQVGCCAVLGDLYYDAQDVIDALGLFLQAAGEDDAASLTSETTFRFDAINTAVQVAADYARVVYGDAQAAFEACDEDKFSKKVDMFMNVMSLADELLADQPERMLGFWIEKARGAAASDGEQDQFEENARMILTLWGPDKNAPLHEYAYKLWNGLISTFYNQRWTQFFDMVKSDWAKFDQDTFNDEIVDWELAWTQLKGVDLTTKPNGKGLEVAKSVYELVSSSNQ